MNNFKKLLDLALAPVGLVAAGRGVRGDGSQTLKLWHVEIDTGHKLSLWKHHLTI